MSLDLVALSALATGVALGVAVGAAICWIQRHAERSIADEQGKLDAEWRLRRAAYDREHGDHSRCTPMKRRCTPMPPAPPRLTVGG